MVAVFDGPHTMASKCARIYVSILEGITPAWVGSYLKLAYLLDTCARYIVLDPLGMTCIHIDHMLWGLPHTFTSPWVLPHTCAMYIVVGSTTHLGGVVGSPSTHVQCTSLWDLPHTYGSSWGLPAHMYNVHRRGIYHTYMGRRGVSHTHYIAVAFRNTHGHRHAPRIDIAIYIYRNLS